MSVPIVIGRTGLVEAVRRINEQREKAAEQRAARRLFEQEAQKLEDEMLEGLHPDADRGDQA